MTLPTSTPQVSESPALPRQDPISVRAILAVLRPGQRMTGADLRMASGLPRRTVYEALRTLRERGVVLQRQSLHDSRQTYFWLAESVASVADAHPVDGPAFARGRSGPSAVPAH